MKQLVQSILVYVVIVTVLRGLITNPKYSQYFQFFSGIIMILLMLSPVLSVLSFENEWYDILEEKVLQMDLDNIKEEMRIADERFEEMVKKEYEETVKKQVMVMAEEKGIELEEASVAINQEGEEWQIEEIVVLMKAAKAGQAEENPSIETVRIGNSSGMEKEDTSGDAKSLRKQICSYFVIGEDKVHIWK